MMTDPIEIPLVGGRVSQGVVRVGNTVRKPATENSGFVHELLRHLAKRKFDGAPGSLGTDDRGRDVFTFIDGDVPGDLGFYEDQTLCDAASLIRSFHDSSADMVRSSEKDNIEVVCHNDLSPCNFVFRNNVPIAIIDFDASAPGSRAHDLAYAAWLWLDLGTPKISGLNQQRRLATFLKAYGASSCDTILAAMLERQMMLAQHGRRIGRDSLVDWAVDCNGWTRKNMKILRGA